MAPTDAQAKPRAGPRRHAPLVVMSPAGEETFGVECIAGDWFSGAEIFQTQQEARESAGITEHVEQQIVVREPRVAAKPPVVLDGPPA